jgi:hypothetical protein
VTLGPGEKKTVEFTVTPEMLSLLGPDMRPVVEPGTFDLMVGPASDKTTSVPLTVVGARGETGQPVLPPPPAGSESPLVSDFDGGAVSARYGSWIAVTDVVLGGKSTGALAITTPGADGSPGALKVTGEIVAGAPYTFSGAVFVPGSSPGEAANLSAKKVLRFRARGDGKTYVVSVQTESRSDQIPAMQSFVAGPEWKEFSFPLAAFETDGHDVASLSFVQTQGPGPFALELDEVRIE